MDYSQLIENLMSNNLSPDEQNTIFNMLENSRAAKMALKVVNVFLLGIL